MTLPLYQRTRLKQLVARADKTSNIGLMFERFPNLHEVASPDAKREFLEDIIKRMEGSSGYVTKVLRAVNNRMDALVEGIGGICRTVKTVSRLIIGLGQPHPTETGFRWHHTLGIPYVPGSSLKGAFRAWLEHYRLDTKTANEHLGTQERVGHIIFFDMLPQNVPRLELDVLNVHYPEYYRGKGDPVDYSSPIPVFFLTVAAGSKFKLRMAPAHGHSKDTCSEVLTEVLKALEVMGLGGKTAVGYGRFSEEQAR